MKTALQNVTLEISAKPFYDESEATMRSVARKMFVQWQNLTRRAEEISVLLWVADGSEILEYTGDLTQKFEWAYWFGVANHFPQPENPTPRQKLCTHEFPQKYREDAAPRSYEWLRRLIAVIREVGKELTGKRIRVGATFDNGPEFAISAFKYKKHREIANGHTAYPHSFVTCNSLLHADSQAYAAYPQGIPEGTSLGTFFGGQFREFAKDLGYDYIWLSNGMGFGIETWKISGALFDLQEFHPENTPEATATLLRFWRDFTAACPGVDIETRGSNFSAGVEMATDAAPLRELYRDYAITPPVNSPWAAINFNSGLELAAWMSHIAETPRGRFPYRFYAHDPWFMNSPWLDRYGREPWDIYQPLSISRLDAAGKTEIPNRIDILTVDNSLGEMPDEVPDEVIPHLLTALRTAPDMAAPAVWVYPFSEYQDAVRRGHPETVFAEEMLIGEALQEGLPLNTVISTENFAAVMSGGGAALAGRILIIPVTAYGPAAEEFIAGGGSAIFYGALSSAPEELQTLLGLANAEPLAGTYTVHGTLGGDIYTAGALSDSLTVYPQFAGGGLREIVQSAETEVLWEARQNGVSRVLAASRKTPGGGRVSFLRAVFNYSGDTAACTPLPAVKAFPVPRGMRYLLGLSGWRFTGITASPEVLQPRTTLHRHDNAFIYTVFARNTTAEIGISTPFGAPIPDEMDTPLRGGAAIWHPGRCARKSVRLCVEQAADAVITCKTQCAEYPAYRARMAYHGFQDATVRFFPPAGSEKTFEGVVFADPQGNSHWMMLQTSPTPFVWEDTPHGRAAVFTHVTGSLYFVW